MGWRDLIVTSQPSQTTKPEPIPGSFVNSVNFGTRTKKQFYLSLQESIQNPTPTGALTELTELPKPAGRVTSFVLRAVEPLTIELDGQTIAFDQWAVFTVTSDQAQRIVTQFPGKVEVLDLPPAPPAEPLQSGWLVCYRDRAGRLAGGCDDRQNGTVEQCQWDDAAWLVWLTNGDALPLRRIRSVGKTDATGRIVAAWTVREHGYDGEGRC